MKIIRPLLLLLIIFTFTGCMESSRSAPSNVADKYGSQVVLYSTSWCGYCEKTRKLFKQRGIDFLEVDIESSSGGKQEFDRLGGQGIPLVLFKGRVVEGYAPKAVLNLINTQ